MLISEFRKLFSIRATWVYMALLAGGMAAAAVLNAWAYKFDGSVDGKFSAGDLFVGGDLATVLIVFAVAMTVGTDLGKGTIAWSYLSNNHRVAQLLTQLLLTVAALIAAASFGVGVGFLLVNALGGSFDPHTFNHLPSAAPIITSYLGWLTFGLLAGALAYLLRSGTFAALILVLDIFVLELALGTVDAKWAHAISQVLPFGNIKVIAYGNDAISLGHGKLAAAAILAGLVGVVTAGAAVLSRRRVLK